MSQQTIAIPTYTCKYCGGEGIYKGLHSIEDPCTYCSGRGWVLFTDSNGNGCTLGHEKKEIEGG